jgi:hypothetical protein
MSLSISRSVSSTVSPMAEKESMKKPGMRLNGEAATLKQNIGWRPSDAICESKLGEYIWDYQAVGNSEEKGNTHCC